MNELTLKVIHGDGTVAAIRSGIDKVRLVYPHEYKKGDQIVLESAQKNIHILWQVDDAIGSTLEYITDYRISYDIPFGEKKNGYSPRAFTGYGHYLYARVVSPSEVSTYYNQADDIR